MTRDDNNDDDDDEDERAVARSRKAPGKQRSWLCRDVRSLVCSLVSSTRRPR